MSDDGGRSIEKIAAPIRQLADRLAAAMAPAQSLVRTARSAAESMQLARDLEVLLHSSVADLNKRASLILRCRKGAACYRVFATQHGLLGVAAHEPPIGGGMDAWVRFADWISMRPPAASSHAGRCRCCREPVEIPEQRIADLLAAGHRRAPAVVR